MTNIENVLKNFKNKNYIEALEELDKILIKLYVKLIT